MQIPFQPLTPEMLIHERYKIDSLLGQGGMSRVYLANDERLSVKVAVKENLQTDPQARAQFHHEAEFLARLAHPNLPRVTDYFDDPATGRQYLVMDYVEGQDLGAIIAQQGALPEKQAVTFIVQILDALDYLHSQQVPIIHRDIKPSNIKITPQGKAVLVDFGIAKAYEATALTMTGARSVTPGFAPPEQYGMRTDARSDIYAVGATLYTLLTGQIPPESTLRVANLVTLPPLHTLAPGVSPQVDNAIQLAMEPDTTRRWASAKAFRDALVPPPQPPPGLAPTIMVSAANQPPVVALPKTSGESVPATVRASAPPQPQQASRLPLILGGLVVLLLVGGGVFLLTQNAGRAPANAPTVVAAAPASVAAAGGTPASTNTDSQNSAATTPATVEQIAQTTATGTAAAGATTSSAQAATATIPAGATETLTIQATAQAAATQKVAATLAATAAPAPKQGAPAITIVTVRFNPAEVHRNQRAQFFVTVRNTYGTSENRNLSVVIYQKENLRKSFWHSRTLTRALPNGDSQVSTLPSDTWCLCGPGGSQTFVLFVQDVDAQQNLNDISGQPYALEFTVNP